MNAGDAGDAGDFVEQQILIGLHVADHDFELVVGLLAGDEQAFQNFGNFLNGGFQVGEAFRSVLIHRNANQRHEGEAQFFGVEQCAVAGNQPGFLQYPNPTQAG